MTPTNTSAQISLDTIKAARERIAPYIRKTPLMAFDYLSGQHGQDVLIKCEMLQRTGSFKIRGAANCILENLAQAKKTGVVAASAGNHAQGVAAICKYLGIRSTIVMPIITPAIKIHNTQRWGATVELVGNVYDDSYVHAKKLSESKGYVFIHPFRDPYVIAGQGTIGLELCEDPLFDGVEAVVIPIGGGGLATGCASALKALRPQIKIYGVTAKNAPVVWKAYHEGKIIPEEVKFTLAEGVATKNTDETMLRYLTEGVDDIFSLSEASIAHAIAVLAEQGKLVVEGAGALPVAAVLEKLVPEKRVALVLSGGNIDLPALSNVLQRGLVEQGRLVRLVITAADRPGTLHAITEVFADKRANILQVFHQRTTPHTGIGEAEIEVDLETRGPEHTHEIIDGLSERGFRVHRVS